MLAVARLGVRAQTNKLPLPHLNALNLLYAAPPVKERHTRPKDRAMSTADDDYVYDEASGEWMPASELAARTKAESVIVVRDSVGNILQDGDAVVLVKDLDVKGAGQTLRRGTVIRYIRLTGDAQEIDCKHDTIRGLVLRAEFVRKH